MNTHLTKFLHATKLVGLIGIALMFLVPTALAQPVEVIVDNRDANTSQVKFWWPSIGKNAYRGDSVKQNYSGASFKWYPKLPIPGDYKVYAWWTYHPNRASRVPYMIRHDGGTSLVLVNQQDPDLGGQWNLLGRFTFSKLGLVPSINVDTRGGQANADAVRFVLVGELPPEPGQILGFYSAPKVEKMVAPGSFGSVRSTCAPGDYAVSGSWVAADPSEVDPPEFRFRIDHVGLHIDINNGNQSWQLGGFNYSPPPLTAWIRVQATCADVAD